MQTIVIIGVTHTLRRCATCAGGAVPDLPALMERHRTTKRLESVATIAPRTVRDFKLRQTGEDG